MYEEIPITALCYTDDDIKCGPFGTQLKQSEYQENGVAVWGIPQINSGFSIAPDTFVTPEKAKRLEQFSLISGDIAMSRKGNVGQCALFHDNFEKGIIASDVVRIRVNKDLIMPQFLVYQLHNSHKVRRQILNVSDGSIMAGINVTKLKKIHVYSPPLERQKQFVSIVRQVDKSKFANFKSRFIEMFGTIDNPKVPVKRMIDISVSSGQYGLNASAVDFIDGRPRYIRITDICDDGSLNDDIKCSDIDDSAYLVKNGDVLFARTGATVGKTYLHRAGDACFAGYLIRYSFTEVVDPEYILAYTHSATYYDWVLKSQKVGAQPNISASQYDNMPVLIPSITEQEEFLHLFRQSDKSKYLS